MNSTFQTYYGKSIRIAPDGFSFFRQSGKRLEVTTFPNSSSALLTTEAPRIFDTDEPVTIVAARHVPMLVPAALHNPDKHREYLDLQFDTSSLGEIFTDTVGDYKAVYFLTKNETDTLGRLPFSRNIVAETTLLYQFLCEQNAESSLFVAANPAFTDIVAVHKGNLAFANRFHQTEPADTLYYICNVVKQYNLHQPEIFLHSFMEENKKLPQLLKSYKLKIEVL